MTYLTHVREEFLSNIEKTIAQGLKDKTPEPDYTKKHTPESTYGANLEILYLLVLEDRKKEKTDEDIVDSIIEYLRPPYQDYVKGQVNHFQSAGATSKDVIDNLLRAYSLAIERNKSKRYGVGE